MKLTIDGDEYTINKTRVVWEDSKTTTLVISYNRYGAYTEMEIQFDSTDDKTLLKKLTED